MSSAPLYTAVFARTTSRPDIIEAEIIRVKGDETVARVEFSLELLQQVIAEAVRAMDGK